MIPHEAVEVRLMVGGLTKHGIPFGIVMGIDAGGRSLVYVVVWCGLRCGTGASRPSGAVVGKRRCRRRGRRLGSGG